MKCKCGNEWVFRKNPRGDMLVCDTCNVEWDADEVISELEAENERLKAENERLKAENNDEVCGIDIDSVTS